MTAKGAQLLVARHVRHLDRKVVGIKRRRLLRVIAVARPDRPATADAPLVLDLDRMRAHAPGIPKITVTEVQGSAEPTIVATKALNGAQSDGITIACPRIHLGHQQTLQTGGAIRTVEIALFEDAFVVQTEQETFRHDLREP